MLYRDINNFEQTFNDGNPHKKPRIQLELGCAGWLVATCCPKHLRTQHGSRGQNCGPLDHGVAPPGAAELNCVDTTGSLWEQCLGQ